MDNIKELCSRPYFELEDIVTLLSLQDPQEIEVLSKSAEVRLLQERGNAVYFRGLVEFSNICTCDCYYCGIRKSNTGVQRYLLQKEQIVEAARWCAQQGYGSIVLQSGERRDESFIDFVEDVVRSIKEATRSPGLPLGLGITLCVGEQNAEAYKRFFRAGAHRYLLRIETTSADLFSQLHPKTQSFSSRKQCLDLLKKIGFLVGTGVMIGLPGQTVEDLARDILFFRDLDIDMIGMGPYIVHPETPLSACKGEQVRCTDEVFLLSLKMIAVTRLVLRNVNIAATTALQAIKGDGREQGLLFGANVIMPQLTPEEFRKEYLLYEGKPCLDENAEQCKSCLSRRVASTGRVIAYDAWGDRRVV